MTKGYFEFDYLKRRDLNDEVQKAIQNSLNLYNSVAGTVNYFANLPSASTNLNKIWLVRFATTVLGIITKQAGLYISDGTNWNWMTSLEAKAEKNTTISAGNGLTGGGDLSANRTISHNDTSSQANVVNTGGNVIQSANLDDFGHITSFSSIDLDNRYITTSGAYANPTWITSLDANKLTGTIPSNVLGASTLYIGTTEIALNRASGNQALTGIGSVQFTGATSGTATIQAPAVAGTTTFTLPATSGNLIGSGDVGSVSNAMLTGSIADTKLNTITTAGKVANSATTATNLNTVNTIVSRDASGNFSAGTITASLSGNSTTATTLQTARTINGVSFSGSENITITANTPNALTISSPLTGGSFNGNSAISIGIQTATSLLSGALLNTDWINFNTAYDRSPTALSVIGTTTKTITLTKQDGTTLSANWTDLSGGNVTSVFGRTGAVVATEGDYSLNLLSDTTIATPVTNQLLRYDGTNWVNWTANYLTLTSLSATSPLNYNNTTGVFSIDQSNTTTNGFLSSVDWNTFNNKQNAITLTTTGSSGASTFVSNTLNIPNYTLAGLGGQPLLSGTGFVKANGTTITYDNSTYLTANQTITLSGDITGSGTTAITTALANSGVVAGTYQSATTITPLTIDAKGRITSVGATTTIAPAFSSITNTPTTIAGYGIIDGVTLTGTETLTNKTVNDATFTIQDETDNSKKAKFELSGIATATTRTYTLPNVNGTLITDQEYTANDVLTKIKTVDGVGSGLDANLLNGLPLSTQIGINGPVWPSIPFIKNDGVMEVGRYLDFHASSVEGQDYTARLDAGSATTARTLTLPINAGTLISTGGNGVVSNSMLAQITAANKVANSATTATNNNTANAIVSRDNSGNFLANFVKFRLAYEGNDAFAVVNTTSTLTGTQLHTLVIESTPTADITLTLPTGTTLESAVMGSLATNASFTWSIVNIATGFTITMAGNTGSTYTGNAVISANSSASFRTQKTAANTFKTVRI